MPARHIKRSRRIIRSFEAEALKKRSFMMKVVDFMTSYFGTISFLIGNALAYGGWIFLNSGKVPWFPVIDPFPYPFLNSFISLEALGLTIIVLMSQNRENQRDILRNELALQVELISEKEITKLLSLLKKIVKNQENTHIDPELDEMTEELDAGYIERKLTEQLENSEEKPILEIEQKIKESINKR